MSKYNLVIETNNATEIINSDDPQAALDKFHFYERYQGLLTNESKLAHWHEDKTFVFVGSGPLPLTLILFRQKFGCKCIGLIRVADRSPLVSVYHTETAFALEKTRIGRVQQDGIYIYLGKMNILS